MTHHCDLLLPASFQSQPLVNLRLRTAFTLIELLIVVVIIGILAAIAIPKFQNTKGKAYTASLKTDLRNLATAEEAYFYDNFIYSTDTAAMKASFSSGVLISFGTATAGGWSATV